METFTTDWMSMHTPAWTPAGRSCRPARGRRAGDRVFEGRATLWFLQNILTHPASTLICVDDGPRDRFAENTKPYRDRIRLHVGQSQEILRDRTFSSSRLDFVYIDGSHRASDVLEDAVLTFRLVKPGGVIIFDDYLWRPDLGPLETPRIAIDAFLNVFRGQYRVLGTGYQVAIQKT